MALRTKTLLIIGVTLVGLIGLLYASSQRILLRSYTKLENDSVRREIQRGLLALDQERTQLEGLTEDWAIWDATYAFVQDANPDYITSNIVSSTFTINRFDFFIVADTAGNVVYSTAYNTTQQTLVPVPAYVLDTLSQDQLLSSAASQQTYSGVIQAPAGIALIAASPDPV